jgi:3-deoxy-manno-octulosonate cytidylyltransferase (CMP-KDO synthetase)
VNQLKNARAFATMAHSPDEVEQYAPHMIVVGMIPARYESTRLPGKPLRTILGKPMIQRVLDQAQKAHVLDEVYVATDDARIAEAVERYGGRAIMTSPNHPSGTDRLAEAVTKIKADIVVNIQGDQPFIDPLMIEECVNPLFDDPKLPMTTLMHPIHRPADLADPGVVKVVTDLSGNALYFSRSLIPYPQQSTAHCVYEHVGLYAYRTDFLLVLAKLPPTILEQVESLEQLRVIEHGHKLRVVESGLQDHAFSGFSVDTEDDLMRAEAMLRDRGLK